MAGLVAAGLILGVRTLALWAARLWLRRGGKSLALPGWQRVWVWAAAPLAAGIGLITMALGQPVLPWPLALGCAATALAGLALALWASNLAATDPLEALWLAADGAALAAPLLLLHALELPARGISSPAVVRAAAIAASSGPGLAGDHDGPAAPLAPAAPDAARPCWRRVFAGPIWACRGPPAPRHAAGLSLHYVQPELCRSAGFLRNWRPSCWPRAGRRDRRPAKAPGPCQGLILLCRA
jgi:hypothetical protein